MNTTLPEKVSSEHAFLRSMPPALHPILLQHAARVERARDEIIFRQGEPASRFYLIEKGRVAIESPLDRQTSVQVQTLGPGEALGWSWLFEPFTWNFQARALEPVTLLSLDAAHLLRLSHENHEFGYELMKRLARVVISRLQSTRRRLVEVAGARPPEATAS
jgi:CRP-like cAMP-binding protein